MKLIENSKSTISLELTNEEFNFLREALREFPRSLHEKELPTLTGFTREQVFYLQDNLSEIAETIGLSL